MKPKITLRRKCRECRKEKAVVIFHDKFLYCAKCGLEYQLRILDAGRIAA